MTVCCLEFCNTCTYSYTWFDPLPFRNHQHTYTSAPPEGSSRRNGRNSLPRTPLFWKQLNVSRLNKKNIYAVINRINICFKDNVFTDGISSFLDPKYIYYLAFQHVLEYPYLWLVFFYASISVTKHKSNDQTDKDKTY